MSGQILISIVITAHNAAKTIGACLESLQLQQGIAGGEMEILLVDDRSTDGTADLAIAAGVYYLRILRISEYQPGHLTARQQALDLAFRNAKGGIICILDADSLAPANWLRIILDRLAKTGSDMISGPKKYYSPTGCIGDLQTADILFYLGVCRILNKTGIASGAVFGNAAFHRSAYFEVGGFDALGFALTEDLALVRAFHSAGFKLAFQDDAIVSAEGCTGWKELIERSVRVSAGGFSALSFILGIWMLSLPLSAIGMFFFHLSAFGLFAMRYIAGVIFIAHAIMRARQYGLLAYALLYEPAALLVGMCVCLRLLRQRKVQWGGIIYDR